MCELIQLNYNKTLFQRLFFMIKTITETIKSDTAYLIVIGDLHLEDKYFTEKSEKKLKGFIKWVAERDNARIFLNGDIFNVATRASKTDPFKRNSKISEDSGNLS